jgi:OOP family OmpA-OmpF porin
MAEPGEEKESENAAQESDDTRDKQKTESSQLAESEERTISDNLIAKAAADDADIEELKNKQEHEIEPKKSDATGENQITEPNTSTDNEPGVTHEEIVAQALTAETLFADSAKKKQSELNSADAEEAEESRSVEPSSLAKEAGNNILEKVRTDKNFEKNSTNAPLLQDLSIIDGKILVYFSHDSLELSEQSIETLKIISEILSKYPSTDIIVEGYTDSKGNFWYNEKLSQARANVVKSYFKLQGISQARITAQGMGSQNPIGDNETLEGRRKNRRVEIKIEMEPISNRAG